MVGLVSLAAVIRVVTQRFSPTKWGEELRDNLNNGCEGDYGWPGLIRKYRSIFLGYSHWALTGRKAPIQCIHKSFLLSETATIVEDTDFVES